MTNKKIRELKQSLRDEIDEHSKKINDYKLAMRGHTTKKYEAVELLEYIEYAERSNKID